MKKNYGVNFKESVENTVELILLGSIKTLYLQEGITEIPPYRFYDSQLKSISLPSTLTKIGNNAFQDTNLISIVLPEGMEEIGTESFYYCSYLESIILPSTLKKIGSRAFYLSSLSDIRFSGTIEQWNSVEKGYECFTYIGDTIYVHCSDGKVSL